MFAITKKESEGESSDGGSEEEGSGGVPKEVCMYEGAFTNDVIHGEGEMRYSQLSKYHGAWINGLVSQVCPAYVASHTTQHRLPAIGSLGTRLCIPSPQVVLRFIQLPHMSVHVCMGA